VRDFAGAVAECTSALELEKSAASFAARGWAYLDAQAPRLALADFEAALRLEPHRGEAYLGRAHARLHLGDWQQAVEDAEKGLGEGPRSHPLCYQAARVFAQAAGRSDMPTSSRTKYEGRAVECLRDAIAKLAAAERPTFWKEKVLHDTQLLLALQHNQDFKRLAKEFATPDQ
jgi:tetratricopeptide (TPR) repeat protein